MTPGQAVLLYTAENVPILMRVTYGYITAQVKPSNDPSNTINTKLVPLSLNVLNQASA